jgi:small-conductance mechanosensitive channel
VCEVSLKFVCDLILIMEQLLHQEYFGNTIQQYIIAASFMLGGIILLKIFKRAIIARLYTWAHRTEGKFDDYIVRGIDKFALPILNVMIIYWSISMLQLSDKATKAVAIVITFFLIRLVTTVFELLFESFITKQYGNPEKIRQVRGIVFIINALLWTAGIVALLDNLGYDVTTIIAGFGIGGIAIALAAQNIVGDLFNYFVIFFDKPFEIGDFLIVDDKRGTVEHIGIKTTHLRSITGEQLIISNSDLTKSRVHNYKRMERRRILFTISIPYTTSLEHVREIPKIIKGFIDETPRATYDRSHFSSFDNSFLNFETVYYVESPEYIDYMETQQSINLKIFEEFSNRGVKFGHPARTIFVDQGGGKLPLGAEVTTPSSVKK